MSNAGKRIINSIRRARAAVAGAFIAGAVECTCVDVDAERLGIQIPDAVLERMGLKLGDPVEIDVTEAGVITIRKPS